MTPQEYAKMEESKIAIIDLGNYSSESDESVDIPSTPNLLSRLPTQR